MKVSNLPDALRFFQELRVKADAVFDDLGWSEDQCVEYRRSLETRSGTHLELMIPRADDAKAQAAGELLNLLKEMTDIGTWLLVQEREAGVVNTDQIGKLMVLAYKLHRAEMALNRDQVKSEYGRLVAHQSGKARAAAAADDRNKQYDELAQYAKQLLINHSPHEITHLVSLRAKHLNYPHSPKTLRPKLRERGIPIPTRKKKTGK